MKVTFIDKLGSDLTVVNAARVSFAKNAVLDLDMRIKKEDEQLIKYLSDHKHWSPFGHAQIQLVIKAPIFVARQLHKHQVGGLVNEISRRYVSMEPEFYFPETWRKKHKIKKQGSSDETITTIMSDGTKINIDSACKKAVDEIGKLYKLLIENDVAPEQARMILPQNMMTSWYWTGSLFFFNRVCKLRTSTDVQLETKQIAEMIDTECAKHFPISWKYLKESLI